MNPGRFTLGLRSALLRTSARVFEQTKVGRTRWNAYAGEWDITPPRLSVPIWVIEVETEPVDPARLAALGWTSRSGLITQHNIMENYHLTPRNTIVFGVRRLERGRT